MRLEKCNGNASYIGRAGQYLVMSDLLLCGYDCLPAEEAMPFDIVIVDKTKLFRLQVKTTYGPSLRKGTKTPAFHFGTGRSKSEPYNDCEAFAFVDLQSRVIAYRPSFDVKGSGVRFRDPGLNYQSRPNDGNFINDFPLNRLICALTNNDILEVDFR